MKILHVNTSDLGGAPIACLRLHNGLLEAGVDSKVLVLKKTQSNYPYVYEYEPYFYINPKRSIGNRFKRKIIKILREFIPYIEKPPEPETFQEQFLLKRSLNLEMFSFPNSTIDITNNKFFQESDIIHLHWVANFLDYQSFFPKCKKPVIWTLHDMNPFTGGEHYEETIAGINEEGYPKLRKRTAEEIEISNNNLLVKQKALRDFTKMHIVTPSNWLKNEASKSTVLHNFPVSVIPNGLDINVFKPYNKKFSREILDLSNNKFIILFVADSVSNKRKGFDYLQQALSHLDNKDVHICVIGMLEVPVVTNDQITILGKIYDERLMGLAYSAADIFLIPSLMDNLPNAVIESLCCGTPVVGFNIGGIPDMVENSINGFLCPEISALALAETIIKTIENYRLFNRFKIAENARQKYSLSVQAKEYISLYEKILNNEYTIFS